MYKDGKTNKIQTYFLFNVIKRAFDTASFGYQMYKAADLKVETEIFAKAAKKFGKYLGNEIVNEGDPNFWKNRYQNFENWALNGDCSYIQDSFR